MLILRHIEGPEAGRGQSELKAGKIKRAGSFYYRPVLGRKDLPALTQITWPSQGLTLTILALDLYEKLVFILWTLMPRRLF